MNTLLGMTNVSDVVDLTTTKSVGDTCNIPLPAFAYNAVVNNGMRGRYKLRDYKYCNGSLYDRITSHCFPVNATISLVTKNRHKNHRNVKVLGICKHEDGDLILEIVPTGASADNSNRR